MIDFAAARRMMVDGQVRTADVTDLRLLAAMLELPRERFFPDEKVSLAYLDLDAQVSASGQPVRFDGNTTDGRTNRYPSQADRDTCTCVVLEADRKLSYHLGYSSKATMLNRLMHRFHRTLSQNAATKEELERVSNRSFR